MDFIDPGWREAGIVASEDGRGVATVTLDRPHVRNAWNMQTVRALTDLFEKLGARPTVRAAIITGAGEAFSAGGDLNWMRELLRRRDHERRTDAESIMRLFETLDAFPHPLIARVNGAAFGGGFGILCTADIAIASRTALFGLSEVRLGIVPGSISPFVIQRLGSATARAHCLAGAVIDVHTALAMGLVHQVVEPGQLDVAVQAVVATILKSAPAAIASTKQLFRELGRIQGPSSRELAIGSIVEAWRRPEAMEGICAFLDKRKPDWSM